MTAKDFRLAASIVRAILNGGWTLDTPAWAGPCGVTHNLSQWDDDERLNYTRAVWTAEAMIMLFEQINPRFNQQKFLKACGLTK